MKRGGKSLAIWGIVLQLGPVVGIVGTVVGMLRCFGAVSESGTSETKAADMAEGIELALRFTAAGQIAGLCGLVLILVALFAVRYRAPWFLIALWVLSILWLLSFPVGTVLGSMMIVYLVKHKMEFCRGAIKTSECVR